MHYTLFGLQAMRNSFVLRIQKKLRLNKSRFVVGIPRKRDLANAVNVTLTLMWEVLISKI